MVSSQQIRSSKEFVVLLREAKLEYVRKGKKPPTDAELTEIIARRLRKEGIFYEKFIPFW